MPRIWIDALMLATALALTGCATNKDKLLPHGDSTMMDIWNQQTGGSAGGGQAARQLLDDRQALRRPLTPDDVDVLAAANVPYTRTARNEIYSQFHRLPDPDMVMYVFPHLAGTDPVPVPGYTTVFPFYQRVQYAMPGERTTDY